MSETERYFIGPGLRVKLRQTIDAVDGMVGGSGPPEIPTRLQGMQQPGRTPFRICTFTGSWSKNAAKIVTYKYQTTTPNTASATNLFANIADAAGSRNCAIAREGTAWFLIAAEC